MNVRFKCSRFLVTEVSTMDSTTFCTRPILANNEETLRGTKTQRKKGQTLRGFKNRLALFWAAVDYKKIYI